MRMSFYARKSKSKLKSFRRQQNHPHPDHPVGPTLLGGTQRVEIMRTYTCMYVFRSPHLFSPPLT